MNFDHKKRHRLNAFTETLEDPRQPNTINHTLEELVRQRLFSLACGYPDANDVKRITLDMDPTDDPTHGQPVLSFFNTHDDNGCYLPQMIFIRFNDEGEPYLVGVMLRPGKTSATLWTPGVLRRWGTLLRKTWPKIRIRVRLDGGFDSPHLFDLLEPLSVESLINRGTSQSCRPSLRIDELLSSDTATTVCHACFGAKRVTSMCHSMCVSLNFL